MLAQTLYRMRVEALPATDLFGRAFTEYSFTLLIDDRVWRAGAASSPEGLGRGIGDAMRDFAERYELSTVSAHA